MQGAGLMRFYAGRDGALQRYVLCANFTVGTGATFAVDMQSIFQWQTARSLFNSVTSLWEFRYNRIVVATQSSSAIASNTFRLELANQPPGFTLESFEFAWDWRQRALSLNFALRDANHTRAPGVTTTTTLATPAPTQPSFSCQRNCNGQGTCIDTDVCQCFVGFVPDPNTGCVSADLIHAVTMTDATSTSNQSTVAIPESVSVRSVSSDSFAGISLEILIGAVIGAVLGTVLIVVVVIFVVRSCKKKRENNPNQLISGRCPQHQCTSGRRASGHQSTARHLLRLALIRSTTLLKCNRLASIAIPITFNPVASSARRRILP
jgi:hypothetical protein